MCVCMKSGVFGGTTKYRLKSVTVLIPSPYDMERSGSWTSDGNILVRCAPQHLRATTEQEKIYPHGSDQLPVRNIGTNTKIRSVSSSTDAKSSRSCRCYASRRPTCTVTSIRSWNLRSHGAEKISKMDLPTRSKTSQIPMLTGCDTNGGLLQGSVSSTSAKNCSTHGIRIGCETETVW